METLRSELPDNLKATFSGWKPNEFFLGGFFTLFTGEIIGFLDDKPAGKARIRLGHREDKTKKIIYIQMIFAHDDKMRNKVGTRMLQGIDRLSVKERAWAIEGRISRSYLAARPWLPTFYKKNGYDLIELDDDDYAFLIRKLMDA